MKDVFEPYLCQVSESVSCGACCGLYNLPNISREELKRLLSQRTEDFAAVPRTEDDIFEFKRKVNRPHRLSRPFPEFHHCPFLGLIGDKENRVGCLLHPAASGNNGKDYRHLSWYGEVACRTYFCPATKKLSAVYQSILIHTIDNWYDFGLIVTEHSLLTCYFKEVESRLGRPLKLNDYTQNHRSKKTFKEFVRLKSSWPFRRPDAAGPCNYFFENGKYERPPVFREHQNIRHSPYEKILKELDSGFSSEEEIEAGDAMLDKLFQTAEDSLLNRMLISNSG